MKRTFRSLLAAAGLAFVGLGSLLSASPAQAFTEQNFPQSGIDCFQRNNGVFPENGHIRRCGTASVAAVNAVVAAIQAMGNANSTNAPNLRDTLEASYVNANNQIFIFGTQAEYNTWFTGITHPIPSGPGTVGLTAYSSATPGLPVFTVAFEKIFVPGMIVTVVPNSVIHEFGHHADYYYRGVVANPALVTDSTLFRDQVYFDRQKIDLLTPCNAAGTGYFNGKQDSGGAWICTSNGAGATLSAAYVGRFNQQILKISNPYFFDTTTATGKYKETIAEQTAADTGNPDNAPQKVDDYYKFDFFACSRKVTDTLNKTGTLPNTATYLEAVGCYKRPTTTFAGCALYTKAGFPFPYLTSSAQLVFCGVANPLTYGERAGDKWQNLPNANPSTSMMRQRFETENISLYVFPNADIAKAQMGAALPSSVLNPGVISYTQLNIVAPARTRFIVLFEQVKQPNGTFLATNTTLFSAYHNQENGRVVDFLFGGGASDSTVYKTYYQKDFTNYNNVAVNPPCVLYSAQNICSGGVPAGIYAGKTNFPNSNHALPADGDVCKRPSNIRHRVLS